MQALSAPLRITREYVFDRWPINPRWNALSFNQDALHALSATASIFDAAPQPSKTPPHF